jgi:nucleolar protein 9
LLVGFILLSSRLLVFSTSQALIMPKEHKKRGRREEQKRKRQEEASLEESPKRQRTQAEEWNQDEVKLSNEQIWDTPYAPFEHENGNREFFGMLDEEEQAYFKRADQLLELNQFASAEERDMFLAGVWNECKDKELKVASSQSCSRLFEKLIQLYKPEQLKSVFTKFSGQ